MKLPTHLIRFFTLITISMGSSSLLFANSFININGKTYQSTSNGAVSVVNGIVIDGNVVSGGGVAGNKQITSKTVKLNSFNQLDIQLNAEIEIIQSDTTKMSITAEENILPLIKYEVKKNLLVLATKKDYWTTKGIKIKLFTNPLNNIVINGSAKLTMQNVNQPSIKFRVNGAGDIISSGNVTMLSAIIDGSGDINLQNLKSKSATVKIHGSGDIKVYATEKLHAEINGSGDIIYKGNPDKLKKIINGSGDIDEL